MIIKEENCCNAHLGLLETFLKMPTLRCKFVLSGDSLVADLVLP